MTKLTAKGAATRQRIIEGAAGVIREVGLGDTTLDDIRMLTATSKASCSPHRRSLVACCWRSDLATGVRAMQMDGTAPAALDPDRFAGAIVAGIQGGVAILLATGSSADLEAVLDLLLEQLGTPEEVAGSTDPVLTRRLVGVHIDDLR